MGKLFGRFGGRAGNGGWVVSLCRAAPYLLLPLLALLAYGSAIHNDYVWDDRFFLTDYTWVSSFRDAVNASFLPLFEQRAYVRPLPLLTLYLEAIASDRNPAVSHAVNILMHAACSVLVYLIARSAGSISIAGRAYYGLPFLLAAIFAVHPALSEGVIWISSRFDLMATLLMLVAIYVSGIDRIPDWPRAFLLGVIFLGAAFCKESAVTLPPILGVYHLLRGAHRRDTGAVRLGDAFRPRDLKAYAIMFLFGVLYLAVRQYVLSGNQLLAYQEPGLPEHVVRFSVSLSKYIKLTLVPFVGNSPHHGFQWTDSSTVGAYWTEILIAVVFLVFITYQMLRGRPVGWWLLAWVVAYLPVLHLMPMTIGNNIVHQRFMYFPTAVLLAFAPFAWGTLRLSSAGRVAATAAAAAFVGLAILVCWSIVPVWKSDLSLWKWTTMMSPDSVEARENLVWAYVDHGMMKEAYEELDYIAEHKMRVSAGVWINLGTAHYRSGDYATASEMYDAAYSRRGGMTEKQLSRLEANIAITSALLGDASKAQSFISQAIKRDSRNIVAIAHFVTFCAGAQSANEPFLSSDLERAQVVMQHSSMLLTERQPELYRSGALCPLDI